MKKILIGIKSNLTILLIVVVISLCLVIRWLPDQSIIAGGDVGIPNLLPQEQLRDVTSSWWDRHGTGVSSPTGYTSIPYYLFLTFGDSLGVTPDITQKIIFFLIISGGALSIYFVAALLSFKKWPAFIASCFYMFNLVTLSVWQRGILNAQMMLLLAPLSFLILVWGIKNRRYSSIIFINIVTFILSYVLGALGYIFSLWLLWTIYFLIVLIDQWKDRSSRRFLVLYYLILVISWLGINSWWILHLLTSSGYVLGQFSAEQLKASGSDVLVALKSDHEPWVILRGINRFYHYSVKDWGDMYLNPFMVILSWIPTLIIFSTTLVKSNYKSLSWKFLITLLTVVLFFSKGVNPPLGDLNKIPYDLFSILAPLRNPYEKIGILLAIPFSLLFALGTEQIFTFFKRKLPYLNFFTISIVILCLTVLVWPLWLGKLFVSQGRHYAVSIPSYYNEANQWLKDRVLADDTRILQLPLSWGESVDYNWGYTGIEPSQYFFNGSSIGYEIGVAPVDARIRDLILLIHKQDTADFKKAIGSLNVGWIVVHNETQYKDRILEPPERINAWLNGGQDFAEHVKDFGPLSIWKVKDQYRLGHFYSTDKLIGIGKPKKDTSLSVWGDITGPSNGFLTEVQKGQSGTLEKYINKSIINPTGKMKYTPLGSINNEEALKELAIISKLPDSPLYPLVILKEKLLSFLNQDDVVMDCFTLSGKRLKEAALLSREDKFDKTKKALLSYESQLGKCTAIDQSTLSIYLNSDGPRQQILGQLIREKSILENEFKVPALSAEGVKAANKLNEYLAVLGLSPKYEPMPAEAGKQIIVFNYSIPKRSRYSIELRNPDDNLIKSPPKITKIDNQPVDLTPIEDDKDKIRFQSWDFDEGFHEVQLLTDTGNNLLETQLEAKKLNPDQGFGLEEDKDTKEAVFSGEAKTGPVSLTFNLNGLDAEQNYEVSFDTYFAQGGPPVFTITHDTDPLDESGRIKPAVKKDLVFSSYPVVWHNFTLNYKPVLNASSAKISFTLIPWNDCLANMSPEDCQLLGNSYKFDRPTIAKFKNIKVEKIFNNDLVLEEDRGSVRTKQLGSLNVQWKKINPVLYRLSLSNQKPPYILTFSETFHPLWKIMDESGKEIKLQHFSIDGYANGWLVDKALPQNVVIKFVLQDNFNRGIVISIVSFVLSSALVFYLSSKNKT